MIKYENDCVGCPMGCINCGRKHTPYHYCDNCGEYIDETDKGYSEDGKNELCDDCLDFAIDNFFNGGKKQNE